MLTLYSRSVISNSFNQCEMSVITNLLNTLNQNLNYYL